MSNSYTKGRTIYKSLSQHVFPCLPNLGLKSFARLGGAGQGVSGDVIARGVLDTQPVIIKFFRTPCPYYKIVYRGEDRYRKRNVDDKNQFEIGNAMILTQQILLANKNLTPNIIFSYGYGICGSGYQTSASVCYPPQQIEQEEYVVPQACQGKYNDYPQCSFRPDYENGQLSDTVRFLVSERGSGDLEGLIINLLVEEQDFEVELGKILIMIAYTLYLLDTHYNGFVHGDLGPRNVIYTIEDSPIWRYSVLGNQYDLEVKYLPKLWDFSTTYINGATYDYLPSGDLPKPVLVEDLSILFNKILELVGNTQSDLISLMQEYVEFGQTMPNREICSRFLNEPWIIKNFPANQKPEIVFST